MPRVSLQQECFQYPDLPIPPLLLRHDRAPQPAMAVPNTSPTSVPSSRVLIYFPSAPSVVLRLPCRHRSAHCLSSSLQASFFSGELSPRQELRPYLRKQGGIYTQSLLEYIIDRVEMLNPSTHMSDIFSRITRTISARNLSFI